MNAPAVSLRAVAKRFGTLDAVRSLDLDIETGSLCGFLGPNGAGKSTTIRMIMSIIRPDSGSVKVLGTDALAVKDRIGYLPEERGVYRKMRVLEYLRFIARLKGLPVQGVDLRLRRWLERIELPGVERSKCEELSKGMLQKVQFLAAIVHDPELLVLDEPFAGLDPVNARVLGSVIDDLHRAGRTILFSTHQMHQAEELCDRVVLINRGEKLLDSSMTEIDSRFDPRTIELRPVDQAAVNGALEAIPGIDRVEAKPDGNLFLHLSEGQSPQQVMQSALARVPVRSVALRRTSLDDVFVELVTAHGGHARTEARHG